MTIFLTILKRLRCPIEIVLRIAKADILQYFPGPRYVVWQLPIFNFLTKEIAQDSPEIFVAGIRQEAS